MSGLRARTGSSARVDDEQLKRQHGGIDQDRSNGAYGAQLVSTDKLQDWFSRNHLQPTDGEIEQSLDVIGDYLGGRNLALTVPMRENGPKIRPMLSSVTGIMPNDCIAVIDDRSDDEALNAVKQFSDVRLKFAPDFVDLLDWKKMPDVLHRKERPLGKGVTMLAGYLHQYLLAQKYGQTPAWLCQHDAEIDEYARYRALVYLVYGILNRPDAHYVKIAKFGRGNECCMAARSSLLVVAQLLEQSGNNVAASRARQLFQNLTPHKWMLTGEFALAWSLAMNRPFTTGYLEETMTSIFAEDVGMSSSAATIHVANPHPRLDAANDPRKEAIMQQQIGNFVLHMSGQKGLDEWTIHDVANANATFMSEPITMGWIALNDNPVVAEIVPNDRIIPSINMLVKHDLVDIDRGLSLV